MVFQGYLSQALKAAGFPVQSIEYTEAIWGYRLYALAFRAYFAYFAYFWLVLLWAVFRISLRKPAAVAP